MREARILFQIVRYRIKVAGILGSKLRDFILH